MNQHYYFVCVCEERRGYSWFWNPCLYLWCVERIFDICNIVFRYLQVIVGTFLLDTKKDVNTGVKVDASASKLPTPIGGASISNIGFHSPVESSGRNPIRGNDDHPTMGGNPFMTHPRGMHVAPSRSTDWRIGPDARVNSGYDLTGIFIFHPKRNRKKEGLTCSVFFSRKSRPWSTPISRKWGLWITSRVEISFRVSNIIFRSLFLSLSLSKRHSYFDVKYNVQPFSSPVDCNMAYLYRLLALSLFVNLCFSQVIL